MTAEQPSPLVAGSREQEQSRELKQDEEQEQEEKEKGGWRGTGGGARGERCEGGEGRVGEEKTSSSRLSLFSSLIPSKAPSLWDGVAHIRGGSSCP